MLTITEMLTCLDTLQAITVADPAAGATAVDASEAKANRSTRV